MLSVGSKMGLQSPLLSFLVLCVIPFVQLSNGGATGRPYSARMADSIILRGQAIVEQEGDSSLLLQVGTFQTALLDLLESPSGHYLEEDWEAYFSRSADSVVDVVNNATKDTELPLDRLSVGKGLFYRYNKTEKRIYRDTLSALRTSIDLQPRNSFGGLWYYVYPNWSYLDGMFSLLSFYPLYTSHFDINNTASVNKDLFHQINLLWGHCHHETSGLLFHGYDATKTASWANPTTGASPFIWGRALGWFMMGLIDFLELTPIESDSQMEIATWRARFVDLANAVVEAVDPASGAWWQVMSAPGRRGNYIESSASAMFTYSLYKGVRIGLLDDKRTNPKHKGNAKYNYTDVATRAYRSLVDRFVVENVDGTLSYNGTVSVCSLNSTASYKYYVTQPLLYDSVLGSAAFVRASTEHELQY